MEDSTDFTCNAVHITCGSKIRNLYSYNVRVVIYFRTLTKTVDHMQKQNNLHILNFENLTQNKTR